MPFLTLINGAGKWMWKGGKPFDWESPMYKEEGGGLLYKKFCNAVARSKVSEITSSSFSDAQKTVKKEWMKKKKDNTYIDTFVEKYKV